MGAAEARTVLVSVSALPLRRFVLCGRPIKKPGNGVLAPRRNGQFLPQLHGHPAYRLPGARITWFIFPRHPDVAVVRYEVGRSKTEPRSAVIAPNPTNSADYGCTVCHSCAATPVEVSRWHESWSDRAARRPYLGSCACTTAATPTHNAESPMTVAPARFER